MEDIVGCTNDLFSHLDLNQMICAILIKFSVFQAFVWTCLDMPSVSVDGQNHTRNNSEKSTVTLKQQSVTPLTHKSNAHTGLFC